MKIGILRIWPLPTGLPQQRRENSLPRTYAHTNDHSYPAPRDGSAQTTGLRVLLVDDDAVICQLLAQMLEDLGHIVCSIGSSENAAVTEALRCRPDLLIIDARLGRGSGVVAVERIFQTFSLPHVIISGGRVAPSRPGAVVLFKPFAEQDLVRAMARARDLAGTL